jgi:K+-transporting ATPase A subunit
MIATALFFVGIGALLAYWTLKSGVQLLLQSSLFLVVLLVIAAYLSSGSLMTDEMGAFGLSIWKFALAAIGEMAIGAAITAFFTARRAQ